MSLLGVASQRCSPRALRCGGTWTECTWPTSRSTIRPCKPQRRCFLAGNSPSASSTKTGVCCGVAAGSTMPSRTFSPWANITGAQVCSRPRLNCTDTLMHSHAFSNTNTVARTLTKHYRCPGYLAISFELHQTLSR